MASTTSLELTGSSELSIPEIVQYARDGVIRIPTFQRSFVWDAADVLRLFDSIYRGFPVGTILLWKREAPAGHVNFGPLDIDVPGRTDALWVVDGQQRITSLFGALEPDERSKDERFQVYFDLSSRRFVNPRRGVVPARAIPVRDALETRRLAAWTRTHGEDLQVEDFEVADGLVGAIRDYRIAAYVVGEGNEEILREVFDRVNSAGKPMTRAQVFHALFASDTEPGSPAVVVKELDRLNFGLLEENRVVQSLLALRGGDVQRDLHDEFSGTDDPSDWYERTETALVRAIEFLRSQGVTHLALMPYTLPLPVLAAFFHLHPEPSPWVLRLLARWLWRGWINGDTGQAPALRKAVRTVNPQKLRLESAPSEYEAVKGLIEIVSDRPAPVVSLDHFLTNAAHGRIILLALASLGPMRPDGTKIELADEFEKHGPKAVTELVHGHRSDAAARSFWAADAQSFSGDEDSRVLASHAIDEVAAERFREGDTEGFVGRRRQVLRSLVDGFMNSRLERGAIMRPPLSELIVADSMETNQ